MYAGFDGSRSGYLEKTSDSFVTTSYPVTSIKCWHLVGADVQVGHE